MAFIEILEHHKEIFDIVTVHIFTKQASYEEARAFVASNFNTDFPDYYGSETDNARHREAVLKALDRFFIDKEALVTVSDTMENRIKDPICQACARIKMIDCSEDRRV